MPTVFGREPVVIQTLFFAIVNAVAVFTPWNPSDVQLGALNALVAAVLGFLVRRVVTPLADPKDKSGRELVPRA